MARSEKFTGYEGWTLERMHSSFYTPATAQAVIGELRKRWDRKARNFARYKSRYDRIAKALMERPEQPEGPAEGVVAIP